METNENQSKNEIENELKTKLNHIENQDKTDERSSFVGETPNIFRCPDFVLDFLQDKPVSVQKLIITQGLNADQKKKVEHIFLPNEHESRINREAIKLFIEELCTKNPDLIPFFSTKTVFLGTFGFGFLERKSMVDTIISSESPITKGE